MDGFVFAIAIEHAFNPLHLLRAELVFSGVIEINEVNAVAHPMKVTPRLTRGRVVFEALLLQLRPIEIFPKSRDELRARLRRRSLMVSYAQEERSISPGF